MDRPLVPGTRIRLDFRASGGLGVAAGCNTVGATYRIEDGKLIASNAAQTEIGCPQPAQTQDEWVFAFILSGPTMTLDGNELTLTQGDLVGRLLDREAADPDRPLTGTHWVVSTILSGDTASSFPASLRATLQFGKDGHVAVDTSCNTEGGTYALDGTGISFGSISLTKKACPGASAQIERAIVATLGSDRLTWEIDAASLWLRSGDVGLGLTARQ